MCGGGGRSQPDNSAQIRQQEESLRLQREQMEMQRRQIELQQQQYREQLAISTAPPPPAPNPVSDVAAAAMRPNPPASAGEVAATDVSSSAAQARQGIGRRRMRTDLVAGGSGGLSIPAV